jgi:hypothetical protein
MEQVSTQDCWLMRFGLKEEGLDLFGALILAYYVIDILCVGVIGHCSSRNILLLTRQVPRPSHSCRLSLDARLRLARLTVKQCEWIDSGYMARYRQQQ